MNMQLPNFADASVGELFPHTFDLSGLPIGRGRSVMVVELTGAGFLQCLLVVADNDLESPSTEGLRRFNDPDVPILVGFSVVNDALATLVFRDDTGWTTQQPINLRQDIDDIADIAAHSSELAIRTITVSLATSRVLAKRDLIMSPSAASLFCKSIVPYCIALDADSPPSPAVTEALQILNLAPLPEAGRLLVRLS